MAEFLVRAIDHNMPENNNSKDQAGSYKRGDIVQVYPDPDPDDEPSEAPSAGSNAYMIKVPGYDWLKAKEFMEREVDARSDPITRRRFKFKLDDLSDADLNTLALGRVLIKDLSDMRSLFYDKQERAVATWR